MRLGEIKKLCKASGCVRLIDELPASIEEMRDELVADIHDSVRLYRYMWNGMMQGKSVDEGHVMRGNKATNDVRIHPTQKPIDLYRWIFRTYAEDGWRILDTHVGSGTSRRAAWEMGLEFVGVEIEKVYFDLQEEHFQEHSAQLRCL